MIVCSWYLLCSGFSAYLEGAPNYNFDLYRSLVHEITQSFKTISEEVISIQQEFRNLHEMNRIADCLHRVQLAEKEKLENVSQYWTDNLVMKESNGVCSWMRERARRERERKEGLVRCTYFLFMWMTGMFVGQHCSPVYHMDRSMLSVMFICEFMNLFCEVNNLMYICTNFSTKFSYICHAYRHHWPL